MPASIIRPARCAPGIRPAAGACSTSSAPRTASPHHKCGKLIVATDEAELAKVETLLAPGLQNGVEGLEMIGGNAARALEAELSCIGALSSPESGIVDSHGYMLRALGRVGRSRRQRSRSRRRSSGMTYAAPHWRVRFGGRDAGKVAFDAVVNSAGLGAQALARRIEGYPADKVPPLVLAKGNYFGFAGQAGVLAADLSDAGRWRTRRARHARPRRPHAFRPGRRVDRSRKLHRRSAPRRCVLPSASAPIGPACRMARCCPTIAASARS